MNFGLLLLIALCGGLGAGARFMLDGLIKSRVGDNFTWATWTINVSGALTLGLLTGLALWSGALGVGDTPSYLAVVGTGFLGGYTTFSTASYETLRLLQLRRPVAALVHALGMFVLCVAGALAGLGFARLILGVF